MKRQYEVRRVANEVIPHLLRCFGRLGPRLSRLYVAGRHKDITGSVINPNGYADWRDFFADYAALNLCKKYAYLQTGISKSDVALRKFAEAEDRCRETNERFSLKSFSFHTRSLLESARRDIASILGSFSWDDALPFASHGPGASVGLLRSKGHPWYKFGNSKPTATGPVIALDQTLMSWSSLFARVREENGYAPQAVAGSNVTNVPKDARSDRTIAIEPQLNMFYQKGIGGLMRSRLRRVGCDLNDQTKNQTLARDGSIDGTWATIDLASASDTVSRCLVEFLLPDDWLDALKLVRSPYATLPGGKVIFLQKFSSMGNGYTFELESLIFLALSRAVLRSMGGTGRGVSVYGDDIVIHTEAAAELISLLSIVGFKTNEEKSFVQGPFRESCGKHYFRGHDVTPLYLKQKVSEDREAIFWLMNSLRRLAYRFIGMGYGCDQRFQPVWSFLFNRLSLSDQQLSVPDGYGDGGVLRDFDEARPFTKPCIGWVEGFVTRHLVRRYHKKVVGDDPALVWKLHEAWKHTSLKSLGRDRAQVSLPGRGQSLVVNDNLCRLHSPIVGGRGNGSVEIPQIRYKLTAVKLLVPRWPSLGPWVNSL